MIKRFDEHFRVPKDWGYEIWLINEEYCGKILHLDKGKRCSFHYHKIKDEVLYVQNGRITVRFAEHDDLSTADSVVLTPGMSFHVKPGLRHQMYAEEDTDIFEFSTHHENSDSIRIIPGN